MKLDKKACIERIDAFCKEQEAAAAAAALKLMEIVSRSEPEPEHSGPARVRSPLHAVDAALPPVSEWDLGRAQAELRKAAKHLALRNRARAALPQVTAAKFDAEAQEVVEQVTDPSKPLGPIVTRIPGGFAMTMHGPAGGGGGGANLVPKSAAEALDDAAERARALNEQLARGVAHARRHCFNIFDLPERGLFSLVDAHESLGRTVERMVNEVIRVLREEVDTDFSVIKMTVDNAFDIFALGGAQIAQVTVTHMDEKVRVDAWRLAVPVNGVYQALREREPFRRLMPCDSQRVL